MKNNEKYKNAFSNIGVSHNLERKILSNTIYKELKPKKSLKMIYIVSMLILMFVVSGSIVYAKEIKDIITNWTSSITFKDGTKIKISDYITYVEINDNAIKTKKYEPIISMTTKELEKMLGINILESKTATSSTVGYMTGLNKDESIGKINLWLADYITYNDKKSISMAISFLNKNADKGYILAFEEGLDATSNKILGNSYHIDNLNINAVIYTNEWSKERLTAQFLYKNMIYSIVGINITTDEMITILNSLK